MTSLEIPGFVTALLAQEMKDSVERVLKKVAVDYNLQYEDLFARYLATDVEILSSKLENITIKRSIPRPAAPAEERCMARTWNGGKGGQCKNKHAVIAGKEKAEYCKAHLKKSEANALKYGRVDKDPPAGLFKKSVASPEKKERMY